MTVRPAALPSRDSNLKLKEKSYNPIVLFNCKTKAAPGSPKDPVCRTLNALSVEPFCKVADEEIVSPVADETFL